MNKKYSLVALALASAAFTACDDEYLDKSEFDGIDHQFTDVKTIAYTLTDADYATISGNSTNKALALAKSPEDSLYYNALLKLKTLKYFTADCPADEYIPAFIAAKYPNADVSSKYVVTYNTSQEPAQYMADFANISTYTLVAADYKSVWGSQVEAYFLSPSTESKVASLLSKQYKSAAAGDLVLVSYALSATEPSIGGGSNQGGASAGGTAADETPTVAQIIASDAGTYSAKGTVAATYKRGFLLSDGTAYILVFNSAGYDVKVGDVVTVKGSTSSYGGLMQFGSAEVNVSSSGTYTQPKAEQLSANAITAYVDAPYCKYVTFDGKLVISGNYINIEVEGTSVKGSVAYAPDGLVDSSLDGQMVTVTGYSIGATGSSTKYLNVMATSVVAQGAGGGSGSGGSTDTPTVDGSTPVSNILTGEAATYIAAGYVAATYKRGFLLHDDTGNILVFNTAGYDVQVGDLVKVEGKTSKYGGLMQFGTPEVTVLQTGNTFVQPNAEVLSAEAITSYVDAPYCNYVTFDGKLVISGNYINIEIEGTEVKGSVAYAPDGLVDSSLDGQMVTVTGYAIGSTGSSTKYLNVMATSVVAKSSVTRGVSTRAVATVIEAITPTTTVLYRYDGSAWAVYTTADAQVAVMAPADYTALGAETVTGNVESVISRFLVARLPYAQKDQKAVAIYNGSNGITAADYIYDDGAWRAVQAYKAESTVFSQAADGITAKISTYIDNSLLGDEAGFVNANVDLGASTRTYVWGNTTNYGWRTYGVKGAPMEGWLISPEFNFSKATAPYLQFEHTYKYLSTGDADEFNSALGVFVLTSYDGDIISAAKSQLLLQADQLPTNSDWTYVSTGQLDLSTFVGQKVRIAFRYTTTETVYATWEIKNLKIAEPEE